MDYVSVGLELGIDQARQLLGMKLDPVIKAGAEISIREKKHGPYVFLEYTLVNEYALAGTDARRQFRTAFATALTEHLFANCQEHYLRRILRQHYGDFSPEASHVVLDRVRVELEEAGLPAGSDIRSTWSQTVSERLLRLLEETHEFPLEGFVRFRLKELYRRWEASVDAAVDSLVASQEFSDFAVLVQRYLELQEPRLPLLHVLPGPSGDFRVLDEDGDPLEIRVELEEGATPPQPLDILLSLLVSVAPKRVILHVPPTSPAAATIGTVFASRAYLCPGCELCQKSRSDLQRSPEKKGL
ncbi:MAG: putative sporulation protein YtxC [Firmicutes bacterium]|nr:putative sporulation protein YtxC [Bacillota bacterium]